MFGKLIATVIGANFLGQLSEAFAAKKTTPQGGRYVIREDFTDGNHPEDQAQYLGISPMRVINKYYPGPSPVLFFGEKINMFHLDPDDHNKTIQTSWQILHEEELQNGERDDARLDKWRNGVWMLEKYRDLNAKELKKVPIEEIVADLPPEDRKKWHDLKDEIDSQANAEIKRTKAEKDMEALTEAKKTTQQQCYKWASSSNYFIEAFLNPTDRDSPFSRYVGNPRAVSRLGRIAFPALQRNDHRCAENIALLGAASTGKTYLAKLLCEVLELPTVEINAPTLKSPEDLLRAIDAELDRFDGEKGWGYSGVNLTLHCYPNNEIRLPPMIIVIDEAHALKREVAEALLKATEPNDRVMDVGKYKVHTDNVLWIVCTTDIGLLPTPFVSRFSQIKLKLYSKSEIAQIIRIHNPDWNWTICNLVAHYTGRVPREALAFARDLQREFGRYDIVETMWDDVQAAATRVAEDHEIDKYGMTMCRLNVLSALGQQGAISKSRLCHTACCEVEELVRYIMPPLLTSTTDEPALVTVTSRGYTITTAGLRELEKRVSVYGPGGSIKLQGIHNIGEEDAI